jgi:hypothetical protein
MRDTHVSPSPPRRRYLGGDLVPGHIAEIVADPGQMDPGSRSEFYHKRMVE